MEFLPSSTKLWPWQDVEAIGFWDNSHFFRMSIRILDQVHILNLATLLLFKHPSLFIEVKLLAIFNINSLLETCWNLPSVHFWIRNFVLGKRRNVLWLFSIKVFTFYMYNFRLLCWSDNPLNKPGSTEILKNQNHHQPKIKQIMILSLFLFCWRQAIVFGKQSLCTMFLFSFF